MMEPNKTSLMDFLSPSTPQIIPPSNKPPICQLITLVLSANMVASVALNTGHARGFHNGEEQQIINVNK